ncbi:Branched-chain amino acid transport protein (AzlD) [Micromonospora echinaurantiaca]|uniref:Branched-chain amino acid transport protein (AzlD) n=1 Tax=Micromonospora echinaurantiaca TaxID=47857 RepID=A0A1C5IH38_9ACTN|nr:AzlD domain-containing protein [Micromonospora echinaurantiaca]SCG57359.1 Branched-chain amino acid transport protein (AzlD) [Micromonospora echinaurantiaca]
MSSMLVTVLIFAVINYGVKAVGPVLLYERRFPEQVEAVIEALPAALLAGMLVSVVVDAQWRGLDPAILAGLTGAAVAWRLHAGQLVTVLVCLAITVAVRWLF